MACFVVPAVEAAVVTVAAAIVKKHESAPKTAHAAVPAAAQETQKIPFSRKLRWLAYLQWGGAVLLAFEHLWHGEIVPWFPFLTAASDPESLAEMLHEMATVGVCMAVLTTAVWLGMLAVTAAFEKRARREKAEDQV